MANLPQRPWFVNNWGFPEGMYYLGNTALRTSPPNSTQIFSLYIFMTTSKSPCSITIYICIRSQFPTRTTLVCKQRVVSPKNGTNWCNVAFSEKPKGSSACPQEEIGCNCGWERTHTHTHIYIYIIVNMMYQCKTDAGDCP